MNASGNGHLNVVRTLLEAGADLNAKTNVRNQMMMMMMMVTMIIIIIILFTILIMMMMMMMIVVINDEDGDDCRSLIWCLIIDFDSSK